MTAASFNTAPQQPFPKPPPPNPSPPPLPTPPLVACDTTNACAFTSFCSDGGINSHPTGHDIATDAASFACTVGTQCSDALCPPRIIEETVLCTDSCLTNGIQGQVLWEGASRNGICEDGGNSASYRNRAETGGTAVVNGNSVTYNQAGGCGFGARAARIDGEPPFAPDDHRCSPLAPQAPTAPIAARG